MFVFSKFKLVNFARFALKIICESILIESHSSMPLRETQRRRDGY